ncbi:MAG: hypothetical protein IJJ69_05520 [Oscillospiraceae bacterium]|nr:hypothetical protein [Oscillospiraceae bacterium]
MKTYEITLNRKQYALLEKMLTSDDAGALARNQAINGYDLFSAVLEEIYDAVASGWSTLEIVLEESPEHLNLLRTLTREIFPDDEDYFIRQIGKKLKCRKDFEIKINLK